MSNGPIKTSETITFTLTPGDIRAVGQFKNGVVHIAFDNPHTAEGLWKFAEEIGVNCYDLTHQTVDLNAMQRTLELEKRVKELDAEVQEHCNTAARQRQFKIEAKQRNDILEAKIERLETRIHALQEALTDAAVRDLHRKDASDTSSEGC